MKYYSELTKKLYESETALFDAEAELKQKHAEKEALKAKREERAKEVEEAFKKSIEAREAANELLKKFCSDYGAFHYSYNNDNLSSKSIFDLFNLF